MKQSMILNGKDFDVTAVIAARYGISPKTVPNWVERQLLPEPVWIGGRAYFQRDRCDELVGKGETPNK